MYCEGGCSRMKVRPVIFHTTLPVNLWSRFRCRDEKIHWTELLVLESLHFPPPRQYTLKNYNNCDDDKIFIYKVIYHISYHISVSHVMLMGGWSVATLHEGRIVIIKFYLPPSTLQHSSIPSQRCRHVTQSRAARYTSQTLHHQNHSWPDIAWYIQSACDRV